MGIFDKIFKRDKSDQENNAPIEIPNIRSYQLYLLM